MIVGLLIVLIGCNSDDDLPLYVEPYYEYSTLEKQGIALIDSYRSDLGLSPLKLNNTASDLAMEHNRYMDSIGIVSHANFGSRSSVLVNDVGALSVGENIAYGYSTLEALMRAWDLSDGHQRNMRGDWTHHGYSILVDSDGRYYITNIFFRK